MSPIVFDPSVYVQKKTRAIVYVCQHCNKKKKVSRFSASPHQSTSLYKKKKKKVK
jgi:hypothetical protein